VRYPDAKEEEEVRGDNSIEPRRVSPANEEKLQRRAGEKIAGDPRGRSVILGMHVQEAGKERVRVVDVAPTSTAYEAGIRAGDEIVSFDGFKAKTYRDWIDGIRRITTDSPDGTELPVTLLRAGKKFDVELKVPIAAVGPLRGVEETVQQTAVVEGQPQVNIFAGQQPLRGDSDDVLIANAFGDDFINPEAGATEAAIAEIFLVNRPVTPDAAAARAAEGRTNVQAAQGGGARQPAVGAATKNDVSTDPGARIGLAGFRDDADGMFVMLDVGNLPAGNYSVGIGDPSALVGAGNQNIPAPANPRTARGRVNPGIREVTPPDQPAVEPHNRSGAPASGVPAPRPARPAAGGNPQSSDSETPQTVGVPRAVLAQVQDATTDTSAAPPATGSAQPLETPATGRTEPLKTPPTGAVDPINATPTGRPRVNPLDAAADNGAGAPAASIPVGTLTVDQSGTGRMQQIVEGVRVQDVIGQAILIHSQRAAGQTTLPPNLDTTADPQAATTELNDPNQQIASGPSQTVAPPVDPTTPAATPGNVADTSLVAGGVIRSMSSPLPATGGETRPAPGQPPTASEAPANTENEVPQNTTVPTAPRQPLR
jgi:hypothetical protein